MEVIGTPWLTPEAKWQGNYQCPPPHSNQNTAAEAEKSNQRVGTSGRLQIRLGGRVDCTVDKLQFTDIKQVVNITREVTVARIAEMPQMLLL